jgi:fumarate reductase flavoprotein subunit
MLNKITNEDKIELSRIIRSIVHAKKTSYKGEKYMKKKIVAIAMSVLLSVGVLAACGADDAAGLKDGSYTAETEGHNDTIKLTVTVADGKISAVTVDEHAETAGIWENAEKAVIDSVIGKTTADGADTASGATVSSEALIEAINMAVEQAK